MKNRLHMRTSLKAGLAKNNCPECCAEADIFCYAADDQGNAQYTVYDSCDQPVFEAGKKCWDTLAQAGYKDYGWQCLLCPQPQP